MDQLPQKGALEDNQLSIIEEGGLLLEGDKIKVVADYKSLRKQADRQTTRVVEIEENTVCLPGLIDAHTHICFAGSRAGEYAMRNAGKSYLEIAKAGGGIWHTVQETRKASSQQLLEGIKQRAERHLRSGVTTIEVKSGYGLSQEAELKMLRAIKEANQHTAADLLPTCLAAHTLPKDYDGDHADYLEEMRQKLFPLLIEEQLTRRMDAFVEEEAFSPELILPYFQEARRLGFQITVHADQFTTGGSRVAVAVNATSADHLEASTEEEIQLLAKSSVTAMALPGASFGLGAAFTPARKLLDQGGAVAIATDWNPGSAPMGDLILQAAVLGAFEKLTNAELLAAITFRAAHTLGYTDRGKLTAGAKADFCLFPTDNYQDIFYYQGKLAPAQVWKDGTCAYRA